VDVHHQGLGRASGARGRAGARCSGPSCCPYSP
jgi:hypothetical protein